MTNNESLLVARLRKKMGDTPTRLVVSGDVSTTIYDEEGVSYIATAGDVGKVIQDISNQVWTDSEYLETLNSARRTLFKGRIRDFENISETESEFVVKKGRIEFLSVLGVDSSKYAVYTLKEGSSRRTSPSEFLAMAQALEKMLNNEIDEGSDSESLGGIVTESVVRRYDRQRDIYSAQKFDQLPPLPVWSLSNNEGGVLLQIKRIFFPDYNSHFIKKSTDLASIDEASIIQEFYILQDFNLQDNDVESGITYYYKLFIQDKNMNISSEVKSITVT